MDVTEGNNGPQPGLNEHHSDVTVGNNPAKTGRLFAQSHTYFPQSCAQCAFYQGGIASGFKNQEKDCSQCRSLQFAVSPRDNEHIASKSEIHEAQKSLEKYYKTLLPELRDGKFIQKRLVVSTKDGVNVIINRNFYEETKNKYKDDVLYLNKLEYARHAHEMITKATLTDPNETAIDYEDAFFRVYEFVDEFYRVEMKVKCNRDGNFLHILRLFKK